MEYKTYANPNPNGGPLVDCPGCGQRKENHGKGYCYNCYRRLIWKPKLIVCGSCGRKRPHKAYGLCGGCHMRLHHYEKVLRYNAKKYHDITLEQLKEATKECVCCGFSKIVELHHLDSSAKKNTPGNLVGLCPNCHMLIHSYQYFNEIKEIMAKKGYDVSKIHPRMYANSR